MSVVNPTAIAQISDLALVPGQAGDTRGQASVDSSFKDLLAIGIDRTDEADENFSSREESNREDKDRHNHREDISVVAVAVELPVQLSSSQEKYDARDAGGVQETDAQAPALAAPESSRDDNNAPSGTKPESVQPATQDTPPANDNAAAAQENAAAQDETSTDATTPSTEEKLRAALAVQFGEISEILGAIIDRLSGIDANEIKPGLPENIAGLLPAVALQNNTANPAAIANIALLKGLQSIIQQLQQALTEPQTVETAQTVTQDAGNDKMMSLLDALSRELTKLSALLTPVQDENTEGESQPLPLDLQPSLGAVRAQLQDSVTSARLQLKQLAAENESIYSRALSRFQAQLGQANITQQANDALATPVEMTPALTSLAAADAPDVEAGQKLQPSITLIDKPVTAVTPQAIAAAPVSQESANNNSGNNGQNSSPLPTGVAATASGQTSASSESTFARVMSQLARPLPEQVTLHIKTAIADGSSKIHIKLDPEELGKLDIRLDVKSDGRTGVVITADNNNTLNMLQKDVQNLLRALNDAGLQTDSGSLSFNLRGDQQQQQEQGNSHMASNYQKAQPEEEEIQIIQTISRNYVLNVKDGLDITI
jgi:flagellar hook-length control protein FliK